MAYNDMQNESPLPTPGNEKRSAADLIPKFFRTEANRKFLQGTIDQLIQPGVAEKLNGFVGRKTSKAYNGNDSYIGDVTPDRENYQLEPAAVITDELGNVSFYKDYNDYLGSLRLFGANVDNHDRLNSQQTYSWDPHIDFDKFVNFREYYWMPNGPISIPVAGQQREVTSTYTVTTVKDDDNTAYVFNDGLTRNPTLKLYRGQTYRFEIDAPGHPIAFAISRTFTPGTAVLTAGTEGVRDRGLFDSKLYGNEYDQGEFIILPSSGSVAFDDDENVSTLYPDGIRKLGEAGEEVATVYVEKGTIEFTIPYNAPDRLFYISKTSIDTSGLLSIHNIEENTFLDVEQDILGKKTYATVNGLSLSNGMKLKFTGNVSPAEYESNEWYVEGVGEKIRLIRDVDLTIPAAYTENRLIPFDSEAFDKLPFANASSYAREKDYIVINRASQDRNAWSRYNRWFHKSVIEASYVQNGLYPSFDELSRAKRPIIEFEAGIKLHKFGTEAKADVDLVDTFTKDVFSTIEGSIGYNVDGVDLAEGMRVLFAADTDILVSGKIYKVNFIKIGNNRQISLIETDDTNPLENETVFVTKGNKYAGKSFYYNGTEWKLGQDKLTLNQPPKFDLCCPQGDAFSDSSVFDSSTFTGTKIFSYREGIGAPDTELKFPLAYRNIENSGDIVFDFNLLSDEFTFQRNDDVITVSASTAYLRKYTSRDRFTWQNAWSTVPVESKQYVVRQYVAEQLKRNDFEIDVYDNAGDLNDLRVVVILNNTIKVAEQDYTVNRTNKRAFVRFTNDLKNDDVVIIKTKSKTTKNNNGYYEFPHNLERNPSNEDVSEFTLGEVIDHVDSIVEELYTFTGEFPGNSNFRDLGNVKRFGKRFVKHSGPITLPLYHIASKEYNLIKALRYSRDEYAKFKRIFLETAETLGYDGEPRSHVDKILAEVNKDKVKSQPFYFSDMIAYGPSNTIRYTVLDARTIFYALTESFDLSALSERSVLVYLNSQQLVVDKDYSFGDGFVLISAGQQEGDIIEIVEYTTTDGSFVAPTPTKLGLYPKYEPEIVIDDTYQMQIPNGTGPFKIYGEQDVSTSSARGWFYPIYTTISAAKSADANGEYTPLRIKGLSSTVYMAANAQNIVGGQDNIELDTYTVGIPLIRGHDGSFIRAYLDYRDDLLLDFEKRIYNNIKTKWSADISDVYGFLGGDFRENEFTRDEINSSLLTEFTQWLTLVENDYTDNYFYDRLNDYTYNYSNANNPLGVTVPGFWRGLFKRAFDTDAPHVRPWEMLGFTVKPSWWNTVYGPAPYTSNNLILWRDLEAGIVREPSQEVVVLNKFARPGLINFIPVDEKGNLKSPIESGYVKNFVLRLANQSFKFGDEAPVETAWRRSSQFPFAVVTSMLLNKPAKTLGAGFDTSRIEKNLAGQLVYTSTNKHISTKSLVFPNTYQSDERVLTSGFVNYIYNLISSDILTVYSDYQNQITNLTTKLGFKLAGFSDKQKINLILESRSPSASYQNSVFVPQENYKVEFNTSSVVNLAVYSGVVIEKVASGYVVKGYNSDNPFFDYYLPKNGSSFITVSVGGISEVASLWESGRQYAKGQIVEFTSAYYRVTNTFTAGNDFDTENLAKISELPITGGRTATFKRDFDTRTVLRMPYGTKLASFQEVVDFMLGYGARLRDQGFDFNFVDTTGTVNNWDQSVREFLFWTTQGWAAGTVITVSPAANKFEFIQDYAVVDDIYDRFYSYSILQSNGQPLPREFSSLLRDKNSFGLEIVSTDEGLYSIALPLVQKEHVVILDNVTEFNDVIYQPATGYRRDRIKLSGYRSADWNGGLNIPGFLYDNAITTNWEPWKDYTIGSLVKYKQFYYVAIQNVVGSKAFNPNLWFRLNKKPEAELLTNFDYRINQFTDFYDLDTSGFDAELQKMAQHLTGYQQREYLANIINDDVSQYKFYQGMIQDKGTKNALSKMFEKLGSAGKDSLAFYEEWAIQVGRYGAIDNTKQVEFNLKERDVQDSPQAVELVDKVPETNYDRVYRILPHEMYDRPEHYTHAPFPTKRIDREYVRTTGYVNEDDVTYIASTTSELMTGDVNLLGLGEYIWVTETLDQPWSVYQHVRTHANATDLRKLDEVTPNGDTLVEITLDKWAVGHVAEGDVVGIKAAQDYNLSGLYKIYSVSLNKIKLIVSDDNEIKPFSEEKLVLTKLRSVRVNDVDELSTLAQETIYKDQTVWVDRFGNDWSVLKNNAVYVKEQPLTNPSVYDSSVQDYASSIAVSKNNNNLFAAAPGDNEGKVYFYRRSAENFNFLLGQEIELPYLELPISPNTGFAKSIAVSDDAEYLAVGMPDASNIKTRYKGLFDPSTTYTKGEIVKFRESLWKANREILPEIESQEFTTFNSYATIASEDLTVDPLLLLGDPNLPIVDDSVSHFLVRAPKDMYLGSTIGDTVNLFWNRRSYAYPTLDNYLPFDGQIPEITPEFITAAHTIVEKIDAILYINTFVSLPEVGDFVTTETGQGQVVYVNSKDDSAVIYLKNVNGILEVEGEAFIDNTNFIGFFSRESTVSTTDTVAGFWLFDTSFNYSNNGVYFDSGQGLVYADLRLNKDYDLTTPGDQLRPINTYYNVQETASVIGNYVLNRDQVSFMTQLSFRGDLAEADGIDGVEQQHPTDLWVVRVGKQFSDVVSINDQFEFRVYDLDNRTVNLAANGLSYSLTNKIQTIEEIWDGYIDIDLTGYTNFQGFAYEPRIGDKIEDVQTPRDGQGGLALTSTTTSRATVKYVQRNFNSVRVYVTIDSGSWQLLNNIGRYEIRRTSNVDLRGPNDPDRIIGVVSEYGNDVALGTSRVGKLLVFRADTEFDDTRAWNEIPPIVDEEYWFYVESVESGAGRAANPPFSLNKDYTQVYNIPTNSFGEAGPENEGAVALYRRSGNNDYRLQTILTSEHKIENKRFGTKVNISQVGKYYTLFVSSEGNGSQENPGSIEIFKNGIEDTNVFKGEYVIGNYTSGDVVTYKGDFYIARKNINVSEITINDPLSWNNISWKRSKDDNYRGMWDNSYGYQQGSIVLYNGTFYRALTNTIAGNQFDIETWEEVSSYFDYVGYLPNLTGLRAYNENVLEYELGTVLTFSKTYDVSADGQVIVTVVDTQNSDSTADSRIVVYRAVDKKFLIDQIISAPELQNTSEWAYNISMRPDGLAFAISAQKDDSAKVNQGQVYVYRQHNSAYELAQTLTPPNNEESEEFGHALSYGTDNLVVSSLNGDQKIPTTFDAKTGRETIFDNKFTNFRNIKLDSGVVYVFEELENSLIYSEQFRFDSVQSEFGETIVANDNHVYVGIPSHVESSSNGIMLDYRKPKGKFAWNTLRSSVLPVDVSCIEGAFLYNKRTNQIVSYIDYIDPVQGKIAGPAEQEITYKVAADPAYYNVGSISDSAVIPDLHWGEEHVGQIWWNINTARFAFPYQGNVTFQKNEWNKLSPGATIDVYEWVESEYTPAQWDNIADTDTGISLGISGTSLYGNDKYSATIVYDDIAKTFSTRYFFWVQNKKTRSNNRTLSIDDIAKLIARPREQGYRFISFLGDNRFVLNNFENLITSDDLVLNVRYFTGSKKDQNSHLQYAIVADGNDKSKIDADIERKWFDSLIGFDTNGRAVPDAGIPVAKRYGIQNRPRQGMFVNRTEALKQYVERANLVFARNLLVDQSNLSKLFQFDSAPIATTNLYDTVVDTIADVEFVSTNKVMPAVLKPIVLNGRIVRVEIVQSGRGYKVPPTVDIVGAGTGAEFNLTINNLGQVTAVTVTSEGAGYGDNTALATRRFTVLVNADQTVFGKWATYAWNETTRKWFRTAVQQYNVEKYWTYIDWYAESYNQFTNVDYEIDGAYLLPSLPSRIGNVIKIRNIGSGGWLLLEKIANEDTDDYTVNYKTVGRQQGTIKLLDTLYDPSKNTVGYDNRSFDSFFYDNTPSTELRIIFEAIRDDIFVADLAVEYNQLFFASMRYVLSEQPSVDWIFKTSFVSIKHNTGSLDQKINFENNKLASYQQYVEEVKPYSTKIREFVSEYRTSDNTNSAVTDFDNAPRYDSLSKSIVTSKAVVVDGTVIDTASAATVYPRKFWADNVGYSITDIRISNAGSGYLQEPKVTIEGNSGATARAYIGYGRITAIKITNPGKGFINAPRVIIDPPQSQNGVRATASALLGDGLVRTPTIKIKFDRTSGKFTFSSLAQSETFEGTNVNTVFDLTWPMDLNRKTVKVYVDGIEQLRSRYTIQNVVSTPKNTVVGKEFNYNGTNSAGGPGAQKVSDGYTYETGQITFTTPPALGATIVVDYVRPMSMLSAEDRIQFAYSPTAGMLGNDLSQLMTGVDYGGVEIRSYDFGREQGWDTDGWYSDTWDTADDSFEDEIFVADGSTLFVELSTPLEAGIEYNVYKNNVRIDDPAFGTSAQANPNAVTQSLLGDGNTTVIDVTELNIELLDGDVLIIRKTTSDGSITPAPESYDMALSGGDLAYNTARGINPEEIIVDGDNFVTPTTSGGPEELVPGQVLDTLDIQVYARDSGGQGVINSQSYTVDSTIDTYNLGVVPANSRSVIVKLDGEILDTNQYSIDWIANTVTIDNLVDGADLNIVTMTLATQRIADYGTIMSTDTAEYVTELKWFDNASLYITINGLVVNATVVKSESNTIAFRLETTPVIGSVIRYTVMEGNADVNYSQITVDDFISAADQTQFNLRTAPFYAAPSQHNVIVKVGNKLLNPGYNIKFVIPETNDREFALETFQHPVGSLTTDDMEIYLNGELIQSPVQWRLEISNSSVILADEVGNPGDLLEVYVITDGEYRVLGNTVVLNTAPVENSKVSVYQFSNHDILNIERINYDVVSRTTLIPEDVQYIKYNRLTVGEIPLRQPAVDAQYVWVAVNGQLLTPSVDYYLSEGRTKVRLLATPDQNDVIDVIHFAQQVNVPKFAYRQFKDMLNRTHFKRIDAAATTLAQPLNYFDLRIKVEDGSTLAEPNKGANMPGIIWINSERIEYFVKEGNTLRQLRRGTLGTSTPEMHNAGSKIYDQNASKTVPYKDRTLVYSVTSDGITNRFTPTFNVTGTDQVEVFVGGVRLCKNAIAVFDPQIGLDSPAGDVIRSADYTVEIIDDTVAEHQQQGEVVLNTIPPKDVHITIVKRVGQLWTTDTSLAFAENPIGKFLRAGTSDLLE